MKRVYLLSAFLILLLLSGNLSAQKEFSLKQISEKEFLSAKKHQQHHDYKIDTTVKVSVSDALIIFPLDNGKTREITLNDYNMRLYREFETVNQLDSLLGEDARPYLEYLGFCEQLNAYISREVDINTENVYLVRKDNGSILRLLAYFIYNDKYIVSWELPECDYLGGIEIFGITQDWFGSIISFHPKWWIDSEKKKSYQELFKIQDDYKTAQFEWITDWTDIFFDSDNTFVFKIFDMEHKNGKRTDGKTYYRCVIKE